MSPLLRAHWLSSTLKREEIYANQYEDLEHLRANIEYFIEQYYNRQRVHSALGYCSPEEFEQRAGDQSGMENARGATITLIATWAQSSTGMLKQGTQTPSLLQTSSPLRNQRDDFMNGIAPMTACLNGGVQPTATASVPIQIVSTKGFTSDLCHKTCHTLRADMRQQGLFCYCRKVLP